MDYSKENFDKFFYYGVKILAELQDAAKAKDEELNKNQLRYENLRNNLQEVLNKCND